MCAVNARKVYAEQWRKTHPHYKTDYSRHNSLKYAIARKKWRERNRDQVSKYRVTWTKVNADKCRYYSHCRRMRLRQIEGNFSFQQWQELKEQYDYKCVMCKQKKKLTIDHIIPISKGGTNYIINIQPLCKPCNSSKWNRIDFKAEKK